MYTPLYSDSFISEETRLWDNRFVYDRLIEAVESYDGKLVQYLDPDWAEVPELGTDGDEGAPKAMAASKASSVDRHYETDGKWGSPCCRADG